MGVQWAPQSSILVFLCGWAMFHSQGCYCRQPRTLGSLLASVANGSAPGPLVRVDGFLFNQFSYSAGMGPRGLHALSRGYTTELCPQPVGFSCRMDPLDERVLSCMLTLPVFWW